MLDHIYTADPFLVTDLKWTWPVFTDHALVQFMVLNSKLEPNIEWRRDWRNYSKEKLCNALVQHDWAFKSDTVQAYWDQLENQLIVIVDEICNLYSIINLLYYYLQLHFIQLHFSLQ